jgi:hypothetical protein
MIQLSMDFWRAPNAFCLNKVTDYIIIYLLNDQWNTLQRVIATAEDYKSLHVRISCFIRGESVGGAFGRPKINRNEGGENWRKTAKISTVLFRHNSTKAQSVSTQDLN